MKELWVVSTDPVLCSGASWFDYCNAVALGVVRTINTPVYPAPRLSGTHHSRTATGERGPDLKYQRRKRIRRLNEELSRYYVLPEGQVEWACCGLLSKGEHNCDQLVW